MGRTEIQNESYKSGKNKLCKNQRYEQLNTVQAFILQSHNNINASNLYYQGLNYDKKEYLRMLACQALTNQTSEIM